MDDEGEEEEGVSMVGRSGRSGGMSVVLGLELGFEKEGSAEWRGVRVRAGDLPALYAVPLLLLLLEALVQASRTSRDLGARPHAPEHRLEFLLRTCARHD